jgi:signal peptidase I
MLLIVCIAALHTAYCRDERFPRLSIWWSVPIIFVGFVSMFLHLNAPTRLAGFRPFTIPSTSMEPAIRKGDAIMVDLKYYKQKPPKDGDLVIFVKDGGYALKRVIAIGGQTIEGRDNQVFLNGNLIRESYVVHERETLAPNMANFGPIKVPEGKLFVLGDNRDFSYDSRQPEYGLVDVADMRGRPLYVYRSTDFSRNGLEFP